MKNVNFVYTGILHATKAGGSGCLFLTTEKSSSETLDSLAADLLLSDGQEEMNCPCTIEVRIMTEDFVQVEPDDDMEDLFDD